MEKFPVGRAVQSGVSSTSYPILMWGHIIGFTLNKIGETMLEVQWANGKVAPIHPALINPMPTD